jgi:Tripartite tricarboxylate transporter TctB family
MHIRRPKDFYAGLMFLVFGAAAMVFAPAYQIGSAAKMGPGYFPLTLGALLVVLGAVIVAGSVFWAKEPQARPAFHLKPPMLVLSAVVLFGLALRPLGLFVSTVLLVVLSSRASHEFRLKEAILNAALLSCAVLLIFVYFLEFQVPVWPALFDGRILWFRG